MKVCKHVRLDRITFRELHAVGEKLKLMIWQQGHSPHSTPHTASESCSHINATRTTSTSPFIPPLRSVHPPPPPVFFLEVCKVLLFPFMHQFFKPLNPLVASRFQYSPGNVLQKDPSNDYVFVCTNTQL